MKKLREKYLYPQGKLWSRMTWVLMQPLSWGRWDLRKDSYPGVPVHLPSQMAEAQGMTIQGHCGLCCSNLSQKIHREKEEGGKREWAKEKKRGTEKEHSTKYTSTGPPSLGQKSTK